MLESLPFRTRARTIDHLGREQIADCPTAISELWKNAYDAYATQVELHLFGGSKPVAALVDNGHGMTKEEFTQKWLVVGTESKAFDNKTNVWDMRGLPERAKQGQKGIGRLSSAALGPLLLLVSKRDGDEFVASLIDWRLFENPFLYLQDIEIPVVSFQNRNDLLALLPEMTDRLLSNIWGRNANAERDSRVANAWAVYSDSGIGGRSYQTSIENSLIELPFSEAHFEKWTVWSGEDQSGTAMFITDIVFDLEALIPGQTESSDSQAAAQAKDRLLQTLTNFVDPYSPVESPTEESTLTFAYAVSSWVGALKTDLVSSTRTFGYSELDLLEHVVEGSFDEIGRFRGRVKAFGQWLDGDVCIDPTVSVPSRIDSRVGPFHMRIGTLEQLASNSTHSPEIHAWLDEQAGRYSGLMLYRDNLRVMPYGREGNDFFEIERRRTQHAGREFWSLRRIFGRVAISRDRNQNLKDKAGREGIIDNKAAKVFRDLVENVLRTTARRFDGSDSRVRKTRLPEIQAERAKERAEEARRKVGARKRREFRTNLNNFSPEMQRIVARLEVIANLAADNRLPDDEFELRGLRDEVGALRIEKGAMGIGTAPAVLGSLEKKFAEYRSSSARASVLLSQLDESLLSALRTIRPQTPREIAISDLNSLAAGLHQHLRKWLGEARSLLNSELTRVADFVDQRNKAFHAFALPLIEDLDQGRVLLEDVLVTLATERDIQDSTNAEFFEPYISTLRSLQESVDLDSLISESMSEVERSRGEIDRLNSLAQLGITVEIVGHEIEGLDARMSYSLDHFSAEARASLAYAEVRSAQSALSSRLRFLSPLKLSGERINVSITGRKIYEYCMEFLKSVLESSHALFIASDEFMHFAVYDQEARILPVFINLVNNAAFWVSQAPIGDRMIELTIREGCVVVSDTGPGVDPDDVASLFSLFFTRRARGGRGVGLYLCRANLASAGFTINYTTDPKYVVHSGANFVLDFRRQGK